MQFSFTTKNHIDCTTDTQIIEADNIREAIIKALFVPNVETIKEDEEDLLECFTQKEQGLWVNDSNESIEYFIELHS